MHLTYNLEILYDKYSPLIIAGCIFIYNILVCHGIYIHWLEHLFVPSLFTSIHMYNSRKLFKFCRTHRCLVNYCTISNITYLLHDLGLNPTCISYSVFAIVGNIVFLFCLIWYYNKDKVKIC